MNFGYTTSLNNNFN